MLVYISHPFGNDFDNMTYVEDIIKELSKENPDNVYISPIHAFGFLYDCTLYEQGLNMCLELLDRCDEMLVYGDYENSRGCIAEIEYCEDNQIPYIIKGDSLETDCYDY